MQETENVVAKVEDDQAIDKVVEPTDEPVPAIATQEESKEAPPTQLISTVQESDPTIKAIGLQSLLDQDNNAPISS